MIDKSVTHFGGIDILVLNAGAQLDRNTVEESDLDGWRGAIEVNLFGPYYYYCARAAIPYYESTWSWKIIMIGSGMGHKGGPGSSAYSCSKAGLWMLTDAYPGADCVKTSPFALMKRISDSSL